MDIDQSGTNFGKVVKDGQRHMVLIADFEKLQKESREREPITMQKREGEVGSLGEGGAPKIDYGTRRDTHEVEKVARVSENSIEQGREINESSSSPT